MVGLLLMWLLMLNHETCYSYTVVVVGDLRYLLLWLLLLLLLSLELLLQADRGPPLHCARDHRGADALTPASRPGARRLSQCRGHHHDHR